ncbi:uncharacterized protein [Dermacentor andersoni]
MRKTKKGAAKACAQCEKPEGPSADPSAERKRQGCAVISGSFPSRGKGAPHSSWKSSESFAFAYKPEQAAGGLCPLSTSHDSVTLRADSGYRAGAPLALGQRAAHKQLTASSRRTSAWDRLALSLVPSKRIEAAAMLQRRKFSLDLAMSEEDVPGVVKALASACEISGGVATLPRLKKSPEDLTKRSWLDLREALRRRISNRLRRTPSLPVMDGGRSASLPDDDDDLTGTSLGRSSRNGSAYTLYEDEDGCPVFPEPEGAPCHPSPADSQPPHRGSLTAAQSVPFGISELGNDDSSPDEKKDVYARFFARKTRTLEKASPGSSKQKAVKSLRSKGRDLSVAHRSKSLTQIDCLEGGMSRRDDEPSGGSSPSDASGQPQSLQSQPSQSSPSHQPPPSPDRLSVPEDAPPQRSRLRHTSRVPSQEYLAVAIEDDVGDIQLQESIPAVKGVILRDALTLLLERRGLDLSAVQVLQEGSRRPANLSHETHKFAGQQLRVKAKDGADLRGSVSRANSTSSLSGGSWKTPASRTNSNAGLKEDKKERKISGSQRGRRGAVSADELVNDTSAISSTSQESSWKAGKSKPVLGKRTGILLNSSKTDKEMRTLTELLNSYDQNGIPNQPGLLTFRPSSSEEKFRLEDNWTCIVDNPESLPKRVRNQQDAIWELISTEVSYIRTLKVITELFLACLCNLQSERILQEIDTEHMFSNILEVCEVNHVLWDNCLLPALTVARANRTLLNPLHLREGFLRFEETFQPYMKYCLEQTTCLHYVKEKRLESDLFKTYVAWCEARKDCERLRFTDLLVKPMQRLTKYPLLLKAIHKKTDDEEAKNALVEMNECVEAFVYAVDGKLRHLHERDRLKSITSRIESYDPFDINNDEVEKALKAHCVLDLTCPMPSCGNQQNRQLLFETSGVKLKDAGSSSKVDVHCFLFTDVLLVCKSLSKKGDRVKVIRQPFLVERLVTYELRDNSGLIVIYLNDFGVAASYFLLYTSDPRSFMDQIRRAQEQYREAKSQATSEKPQLGYLQDLDDEDDLDIPRSALLVAARSPRSSSHSSLVHSHSGSIDMSDPASVASLAGPPVPCPTPLFQGAATAGGQGRATSFELGELRNPSMTYDDLDEQGRSRSMETRTSGPVCVTVTSPRPERRAFLLKGAGTNATSPNTLTVSIPFTHPQELEEPKEYRSYPTSPTIQVPVMSSLPPKSLSPTSRFAAGLPQPFPGYNPSGASKPPLLKTKNVSGLVTHSAPPSEGPSPVHSLEGPKPSEETVSPPDSEDESGRKRISRRTCRPERRHHTADSFEHLKNQRDPSIHKRLSWNCGQQHDASSGVASTAGRLVHSSEAFLKNKHVAKCLSSESVYSSSGVSSTGSLLFSSAGSGDACDCCCDPIPIVGPTDDQKRLTNGDEDDVAASSADRHHQLKTLGAPGECIKIDVSEVKDGISSVQIVGAEGMPVAPGKPGKPSRSDLQKMKEFLLNSRSVEAS